MHSPTQRSAPGNDEDEEDELREALSAAAVADGGFDRAGRWLGPLTPKAWAHVLSFLHVEERLRTVDMVSRTWSLASTVVTQVWRDLTLCRRLWPPHVSVDAALLLLLTRFCANGELLHSLTLDGLHVSDRFFHAAGVFFTNLRRLDLSRCQWLTGAGLIGLVHVVRCPNLRELDLSRCPHISDEGLEALGSGGCPALRRLVLARGGFVTDRGLEVLFARGGCPRLEVLDLTNCTNVTDAGLEAMVRTRHTGSLRALILLGCTRIKGPGVAALGAGFCPRLQHLNLTGCRNLEAAGVAALGAALTGGCPELSVLELSGCRLLQGEQVACVAAEGVCAHLLHLDVSYCPSINDALLTTLGQGRCPHLVTLDLAQCRRVTSAGVRALATGKLPKLRVLNMQECVRLDDDSLRAIGRHGALPQLRVLNLNGCFRVTDAGVCELAQGGTPLLASLHLSACLSVTDVGASAIGCGALPELDTLDLSFSKHVTNDAVVGLLVGGGCPRLRCLLLTHCKRLTAEVLRSVIPRLCAALRVLDMGGCAGVTEQAAQRAAQAFMASTGKPLQVRWRAV